MRGVYVFFVIVLLAALAGCVAVDVPAELRAGVVEMRAGLAQSRSAWRVVEQKLDRWDSLTPDERAKAIKVAYTVGDGLDEATSAADAALGLAQLGEK